jgi:hypothetical protein
MDCVTVLCCSNMSGTDKWKLLVTGKRAKSHYFKGNSKDSLSLLYYDNTCGWHLKFLRNG